MAPFPYLMWGMVFHCLRNFLFFFCSHCAFTDVGWVTMLLLQMTLVQAVPVPGQDATTQLEVLADLVVDEDTREHAADYCATSASDATDLILRALL